MNNLHIFTPYHDPAVLESVPNQPWMTKVLLGNLNIDPPELQDNRLGEGRLFLSGLRHPAWAEWVGVLNARCKTKYFGFDWLGLGSRLRKVLKTPQDVVICWPTANGYSDDWVVYSEHEHPGMGGLLHQVADKLASDWWPEEPGKRPSFWGNDFVCHWTVWREWLEFWRNGFHHLHEQYGFDPPFECIPKHEGRKPAYLYERVTTLFFALGNYNFHTLTVGVVT